MASNHGFRTRRHLFAEIGFSSTAESLEAWRKTFPDPVSSPACRTHVLYIGCLQALEEAEEEEGGWIQIFSRVEQLTVDFWHTDEISLVPLHRLSPSVKSLRMVSPHPTPAND